MYKGWSDITWASYINEQLPLSNKGLNAIASTNSIGTPKLLCKGVDREKKISFLMMEMIPRTDRTKDYYGRLRYPP
jgi:fructosamine-3-kinase